MASIADNSKALQVMSDANKDFLSLILNLREFLSGREPVTFTVGGQEITVNSLLKIIDDYRNGIFDEITLGGQDSSTRIRLFVNNNGDLAVTDTSGRLATISCEKFSTSTIDKCQCNDVTVNGATIRSAEGSVSVKGGDFSFSRLQLDNLDVGVLNAGGITTKSLEVTGNVSCWEMFVTGTRRFSPQNIRNVFYNNVAIDHAGARLTITNNVWDMSQGLSPSDLGFVTSNGNNTIGTVVPDLIKICGENKYSEFRDTESGFNRYYTIPNNVDALVANTGSTNLQELSISDRQLLQFAALMMWPTGLYDPANSKLSLCSFAPTDIGKEVYYQTFANSWKIYRVMVLYYNSASDRSPSGMYFDTLTELPAYTCRRFIANCHTVMDGTAKKVIYALE